MSSTFPKPDLMVNYPLFRPTYVIEECLEAIRECLEVGWTGMGFKTIEFEKNWKEYTGLPFAHFVNSDSVGIQLALKIFKEHYGWDDASEIITTPLTFVSTNHAILLEDMIPVFADIDESLCLDPDSVKNLITKNTRAVIFVGIGGNTGRLQEIMEICKQKGIKLILDGAHMAGTRLHGKHVGDQIDCSIFSFQAVKNLPTADSGMICFSDEIFDEKVRKYSWLGISKDTYSRSQNQKEGGYQWMYDVDFVGLKANGNSIMASIAIVQLKYLDAHNEIRRNIAAMYRRSLTVSSEITFIASAEGCETAQHLFQIRVPKGIREALIDNLKSNGIGTGVHYRANTRYSMYRKSLGLCPVAEVFDQEILSLPMTLNLKESDIGYIASRILAFLDTQKQ